MCIILPVDHIPCSHTIAIWQHCIDAPRSRARGLAPCQRIRQHERPILTRKLCIHCGGPRFFTRRGGIAERGRWSPDLEELDDDYEEEEGDEEQYGIAEEDEDVLDDLDMEISPRASVVQVKVSSTRQRRRRRDASVESSDSRNRLSSSSARALRSQRSPSRTRRPSWKPNLKRELTGQAFSSYRRESVDSQAETASIENVMGRARPVLPPLDIAPVSSGEYGQRRKGSTLLHPSTPPVETSYVQEKELSGIDIPSYFEDHTESLPTPRKSSTLLHPSTPQLGTHTEVEPITQSRPGPPMRKGSTLLHPSPPEEENLHSTTSQIQAFPFSLPTPPPSLHSSSSEGLRIAATHKHKDLPHRPFTPKHSPTHDKSKTAKARKGSLIHSSLSASSSSSSDDNSDSTPDYRSGRSSSDMGDHNARLAYSSSSSASPSTFDDEDEGSVGKKGRRASTIVVATRARMARASRIEFCGAEWRVAAASEGWCGSPGGSPSGSVG